MSHQFFLAHEGGSNPKEKSHITASFREKNNKVIANGFNGGVRIIFLHFAQPDEALTTEYAIPEQSPRIRRESQRSNGPGKSRFEQEQCRHPWPIRILSEVSQQNSHSREEQQRKGQKLAAYWKGILINSDGEISTTTQYYSVRCFMNTLMKKPMASSTRRMEGR
jgi:hypothetical protein